MKLFSKKNKSKPGRSVFSLIGKDPATDWVLALACTVLLIILVAVWTGLTYFNISTFIDNLSGSYSSTPVKSSKTDEEKVKDLIKIYEDKKAQHMKLLDSSKIEVKKELSQAKAASSTASTTNATTSSNSSGSKATTTPAR